VRRDSALELNVGGGGRVFAARGKHGGAENAGVEKSGVDRKVKNAREKMQWR